MLMSLDRLLNKVCGSVPPKGCKCSRMCLEIFGALGEMHRTGGLFMFGEKSKKKRKKEVNLSDTVLHYS